MSRQHRRTPQTLRRGATGNGVTVDFAQTDGDPTGMHLAFLVTESEFDEIFERIVEAELPYWADPRRSEPGEINHHDGGRGVYFSDPYTNVGRAVCEALRHGR